MSDAAEEPRDPFDIDPSLISDMEELANQVGGVFDFAAIRALDLPPAQQAFVEWMIARWQADIQALGEMAELYNRLVKAYNVIHEALKSMSDLMDEIGEGRKAMVVSSRVQVASVLGLPPSSDAT